MVGSDEVAQVEEAVCVVDGMDGSGFHLCGLEERGVVNVCRGSFPPIEETLLHLQLVPSLSSLCNAAIDLLELLGVDSTFSLFGALLT